MVWFSKPVRRLVPITRDFVGQDELTVSAWHTPGKELKFETNLPEFQTMKVTSAGPTKTFWFNGGLFLAVEPECLGGSCTGDLHGLELGKVGLKLQLHARGVPGRHGQLILANEVPGDGDQTCDGLAEPDHGVRGGPGVKLEVAESLTIQHKFVFNKELSKEEVPVLLVV